MDFADRARIKTSEETKGAGLAGKTGHVHGWTTPSVTGVKVIGDKGEDFAVNVFVEELDSDFWVAPHLVENLGPEEGAVISLDGSPDEFVRLANGDWEKRPKSD